MIMMNETLRPFLDVTVICYLDDILVYSKDAKEHVKNVRAVLMALRNAGLLCKPEKCEFHVKKTIFLGYVVTPTGLSMDPAKVSTVLEWKEPATVKDVQSFLGFANFYRRFINGYSAVAAPLTELTKKDREFNWTTKAQAAFDQLKRIFAEEPFLLTFNPELDIVVETDSSDFAIGAVLSQKGSTGK
jgi:hypothetical protein